MRNTVTNAGVPSQGKGRAGKQRSLLSYSISLPSSPGSVSHNKQGRIRCGVLLSVLKPSSDLNQASASGRT